jgi:hypothetical protein
VGVPTWYCAIIAVRTGKMKVDPAPVRISFTEGVLVVVEMVVEMLVEMLVEMDVEMDVLVRVFVTVPLITSV